MRRILVAGATKVCRGVDARLTTKEMRAEKGLDWWLSIFSVKFSVGSPHVWSDDGQDG